MIIRLIHTKVMQAKIAAAINKALDELDGVMLVNLSWQDATRAHNEIEHIILRIGDEIRKAMRGEK